MASGPGWTDAEDQRLIELWRESNSFAEMAWEFPGRSRNACIGRLTRLRKKLGAEMIPHGRDVHPQAPVKKKRIRRKPNFAVKGPAEPIAAPTPENIAPLPPAARQLTLLELGPKDCRYIVTGNYTRRHLYCAADATGNVDEYGNNCYCTYHRRLMRRVASA
jgi:hypothetical protein